MIKDKWNQVDKVCPACGQVTEVTRGITKQNIKKLFKLPTLQDSIIFILLLLVFIGAYSYKIEIQQYSEIAKNPQEFCNIYYQDMISKGNLNIQIENIKNEEINFTTDNLNQT
jgi:hypothetical protein